MIRRYIYKFVFRKDLLALSPADRSHEGLFLSFQYPVEIPGVSNQFFLQTALNAVRKYRGLEALDRFDFQDLMEEKIKLLKNLRFYLLDDIHFKQQLLDNVDYSIYQLRHNHCEEE